MTRASTPTRRATPWRRIAFVATLCSAMLAHAQSTAPTMYEAINITPGFFFSENNSRYINDAGDMAGEFPGSDGVYRAAVWTILGGIIPIPTEKESHANAINASGAVTGSYVASNGETHAFTWSKTTPLKDLGHLGGGYSAGTMLNDAGQMIGISTTAQGSIEPFFWAPDRPMIDIGNLGSGYSIARHMNQKGEVAGYSTTTVQNVTESWYWNSSAGITNIGKLDTNTIAMSINNLGQITGYGFTEFPQGNGMSHGFFWEPGGKIQDIGSLSQFSTYPMDINDAGQVVGRADTEAQAAHGFLWSKATGMVDLGTLGTGMGAAGAIDQLGRVVGYSQIADGTNHATVWTKEERLADLNDRIKDKPEGMVLDTAFAISKTTGLIVARSSTGFVLLRPVANVPPATPPTIGAVTTTDPVAAGIALKASAAFTDTNTGDTHTALWNWGDGSVAQFGTLQENNGAGTVTDTHSYAAAGVYAITLTITDSAGKQSSVSKNVAVYDRSAGFATGGGWITSPVGAYRLAPTLSGRADFAFSSKYTKNAPAPTGNTTFQFSGAGFVFQSTAYQWLVVSGNRAQLRGTGTVNGQGNYQFLMVAVDRDSNGNGNGNGNVNGNGNRRQDRFSIRIWTTDPATNAETVIYDNQSVAAAQGTALGGGNIVIHSQGD